MRGQCPDEAPDGRGVGAVMSDTALWLLPGRAAGPVQPVEVHLVITDLALFGVGDPKRLFTTVRAPAATTSRKPPGWHVEVIHTGRSPGHPRQLRWTTPTGHTHHAQAPPLTGWGCKPLDTTTPSPGPPASERGDDPEPHHSNEPTSTAWLRGPTRSVLR